MIITIPAISFEVASADHHTFVNWHDAMKAAKEYREGGHEDWRVPTSEELDLIYKNRKDAAGFNLRGANVGGYYWSSSEYFDNFARDQRFSDGIQYVNIKDYASSSVRFVRSLVI